MTNAIREIRLDLTKEILYGWQEDYCPVTVSAMREGIKLRHAFPPVDVVLMSGFYQIRHGFQATNYWHYGGHHRAIAHLFSKTPLACNLFNEHHEEPPITLPITSMLPRDIPYVPRLLNALKHLPNDAKLRAIRVFCRKHHLDPQYFLNN